MNLAAAWRRGQTGWPARFPIVQFPNAPLLVAVAGSLVARLTDGRVSTAAGVVAFLALAVFAVLEIVDGANWFRRMLGAAVAAWLVADLAGAR